MTRQPKTPAQRAQEAYDVAARIADRLDQKRRKAADDLDQLEREYAAAVRRRDYLAQHPDLAGVIGAAVLPPIPAKKSGDTPS